MDEVLVLCEGQTEREFVNTHIDPLLSARGLRVRGTLVGMPQRKRGGIRAWPVYERELKRLALERPFGRGLAVLVDYYAMPNDWPGRDSASAQPHGERGLHVESNLVAAAIPELRGRFVPCVQLHEFETLLFAYPQQTAVVLDAALGTRVPGGVESGLRAASEGVGHEIERINDSRETAPSKRISKIAPGYDKVAWGNLVVRDIGVAALRMRCPWLDRWITALESLANQ